MAEEIGQISSPPPQGLDRNEATMHNNVAQSLECQEKRQAESI